VGRSKGFLGALPQLCIAQASENIVMEFFKGWLPMAPNGRAGEGGVSNDCVARFSTVMTGLASEEEGPS